jgi:serine/threonine protein kinase
MKFEMIGKQLLNYEIKSLIGEGGMGNVYLGEHTSIGRKVAIKVLRPELASNNEIRNRFKNEASVMAHLQHPGIVALHDYLEQDDGLYLIMEYVEGIEFTDLLKSLDEPLPIDRAKDIMKKVLSAFAYAHKNNIVHRDVKPSNILLTKSDEVKVLDFGIAKLIGGAGFNLTKTGTQVGTVYYMSPEQVKAKELDHRSDVYSLGVTFYELLAGFCPYKSMTSEFEIYEKIVREPLLPLTDTMGEEYAQVWGVIQKATEKEVEDRFQNCEEFIAALETGVSKSIVQKTLKNKNTDKRILRGRGLGRFGFIIALLGVILIMSYSIIMDIVYLLMDRIGIYIEGSWVIILGLFGFLCGFGMLMSLIGLVRISRAKGKKGLAFVGIILGLIGIVIWSDTILYFFF